ncbi:hypothetical protein CAL29_24395 [Bordetella genomosp. 10]|uniref:HTH lysR-type domain-containing protein n=1 Tax=Bordetella genomosp. 10 TaxID=1416804 RepID=A0A261S166_9BORD|nr:LysR family transcriptional regulator [Bordetella genomosp. 10]OZI31079.1 hypothetical protein CAL29_24395 [Bordetella genomosp. 10]
MVHVTRDKSKLSFEQLELFAAVVQCGSISAAARNLHMSPSLAARKIAILEAELGTRVFDRTTRRVHLTESGQRALQWAQDVLTGYVSLTDDLNIMQQKLSGTLRIVSNEYLLTSILPKFIANFSRTFPDVRYTLRMTDTHVASEQRDFDLAIYSGHIRDSSLKGIRIRDYRRVLCAAPSYMKRRGRPTTLEALTEHDCLTHEQIEGQWTFRKNGQVLQQRVNSIATSSSHLPLIQLAVNGMGVAQISRESIRQELADGKLETVLDDYECLNIDTTQPATWVVYPGERKLERTRVFVSELTRYLRSLPA